MKTSLNSFKLTQSSEKSGPMLGEAGKIYRKEITCQIKLGAVEEAKTYLQGTTLPDFSIICRRGKIK